MEDDQQTSCHRQRTGNECRGARSGDATAAGSRPRPQERRHSSWCVRLLLGGGDLERLELHRGVEYAGNAREGSHVDAEAPGREDLGHEKHLSRSGRVSVSESPSRTLVLRLLERCLERRQAPGNEMTAPLLLRRRLRRDAGHDGEVLHGLRPAVDDLHEGADAGARMRSPWKERRRWVRFVQELDDRHGLHVAHAVDDQARDVACGAPLPVGLSVLLAFGEVDGHIAVGKALQAKRDSDAMGRRRTPVVVESQLGHRPSTVAG